MFVTIDKNSASPQFSTLSHSGR